ncbi:transglutaminaseTgpA domain-containing protein [Motilimonas sp. KMU-193]|uniref:transglutaminase family protein n=1 Tax=Motilimonas sp. KMU-193 TaxID=3388668 RepID=UPI00396B4248
MEQFLKRHHLLLILLCYFTTTFSLSAQIHWLIFVLALFCIGWRLGIYFGRLAAPSVLVNRFAAVLGAALLMSVVFSQGLFSAMMHLIVLGYTLKFLELSARRDINVFICTGLVLVAVFYVFETSILMALWGIVLVVFHLALAISLYGAHLSQTSQAKYIGCLVLVSLPLALLLFLLLPRLPPMWKLPLQNQATTGLSDTVNPGDIAELSRSSELAFRVSFEGEVPAPNERYWRVMTLDQYQANQWSQSDSIKNAIDVAQRGGQFNVELMGTMQSYELILEPSFQTWVPSLAVSQGRANRANLMANYTLRNEIPISQRTMLRLLQFADTKMHYMDLTMARQNTLLPDSGNEQTRAWAAQLAAQPSSAQQKINLVLQRFAGERFSYTLKPPPLGAQQMDDFLFNTQAGFCVHYAGSFVYIMRLLGLPARMVTGYQGGEWDPEGGFLTVRQYDAHAWAEVYLDGHWQRFDPTAFVAPERVEQGLELALPNEFLADDTLSLLKLRSNPMLNQLYLAMAQFDYLWAVWVLNYDNQKQFELIKRWFGELDFFGQIWLFIGLFVATITLMLLWNLKPWQRARLSKEDKLLLRLQKRFRADVGDRQQGETVTDYCQRLSENAEFDSAQAQRKRNDLQQFAHIYNALKYAPLSDQQKQASIEALRQLLRGL